MLNSITLENFRAFRRESIDFSKLNIFVGPNNSGKSSIISAINLIAQNLRRGTQEFSLALNGPYVELGTFHDTVHGHSAKSTIGIGFDIGGTKYEYKFRYRAQRREIELVKCSISDKSKSYIYISKSDSVEQSVRMRGDDSIDLKINTRARFYGMFLMPINSFYLVRNQNVPEPDVRRVREFLFRSMSTLEQQFADFESVGAFRAAPQRTYHYTGEAPSSVGRNGENVAQMLASSASVRVRSSIPVIRLVARWFEKSGVAKGLEINSLTNRHFEIIVEDAVGLKNNIIDSGFGCSQVLPVLVGGYNMLAERRIRRKQTFVVQEPEIHLHPTAAAHLGSYFVDLANQGIQCFVETHSENVILRVARHVALGEISPDDVRIYWVSSDSGEHKATLLPLSEVGTFDSPWPEGFFPTRANETLQLARAASAKTGVGRRDGH